VRNSSLVKRFCAENLTGLKLSTEGANSNFTVRVVGERSYQRRSSVGKQGGAIGSANAQMSNQNACEKHAHRKIKVSHATVIDVGLVGPKVRSKDVADGHPVNIPEPENFRPTQYHLKSICGPPSGGTRSDGWWWRE
jgi:hypothetical protein